MKSIIIHLDDWIYEEAIKYKLEKKLTWHQIMMKGLELEDADK